MTVVITAVLEMRTHRGCGKSSQIGAYAQLYAYPLNERGDEDTVRDNNHALEIVRQLAGDDGEHFKEGTPPDGAPRMFDIWMRISNTRHGTSKYSADYHRHPGCPQRVASAMMDIYHTIKSVLRESRNALRERKQHKKGTDK